MNENCLAETVTCLGDGHDGIWKIIKQIGNPEQRREVLDGFHLKENLYKIGGSIEKLKKAEYLLCRGKSKEAQSIFLNMKSKQSPNFCAYLSKHSQRIIDYNYYSSNKICSIGSGGVES